MNYETKSYLREIAKEAKEIEVYYTSDKRHNFHTDFVKSDYNLEFDNLPEGEIECDWELMDAERYAETLLANSCISVNDFWDFDDPKYRILVIVLSEEQYLDIQGD